MRRGKFVHILTGFVAIAVVGLCFVTSAIAQGDEELHMRGCTYSIDIGGVTRDVPFDPFAFSATNMMEGYTAALDNFAEQLEQGTGETFTPEQRRGLDLQVTKEMQTAMEIQIAAEVDRAKKTGTAINQPLVDKLKGTIKILEEYADSLEKTEAESIAEATGDVEIDVPTHD